MGRKAKYTKQQKVKACLDYLNETKSALQIARELAMGKGGKSKVLFWVKMYSQYGESTFEERRRNKSYSKDFKEKVVQEYLAGKGSMLDLSIKYNLPSTGILPRWIKMYNSHIELKDYDPKPEVYMAKSRTTTLEERKEIVKKTEDLELLILLADDNSKKVRREILRQTKWLELLEYLK